MSGASSKNEPQMNADERRFVALGIRRGAGSLAAGMRGVRCMERKVFKGISYTYYLIFKFY